MKKLVTNLVLVCALIGVGASQNASAVVTVEQAEEFLDLAEEAFPNIFNPSGLPTLAFLPDFPYYRGPYAGGVFVGISADDSIFVAGGSFGFPPIRVGTYSDVLILLQEEIKNNKICDSSNLPEGIIFSQTGTTINVSSDGCIDIPQNQNICESPASGTPQATGISVLSVTNILSSQLDGISSTNPVIQNSLISLVPPVGETSICTDNANENSAPSTIILNLCYVITDIANQFLSSGVTINPPVTSTFASNQQNTVVPGCLATGAQTIFDAFTGVTSLLQPDGSYVTIPDF